MVNHLKDNNLDIGNIGGEFEVKWSLFIHVLTDVLTDYDSRNLMMIKLKDLLTEEWLTHKGKTDVVSELIPNLP